jgi:hypothetical protein
VPHAILKTNSIYIQQEHRKNIGNKTRGHLLLASDTGHAKGINGVSLVLYWVSCINLWFWLKMGMQWALTRVHYGDKLIARNICPSFFMK